jgi:hypothetical protein
VVGLTTTTDLGSGDASKECRDYRPDWLDNLADDVTMEGSVLTGIAEGPEAIRAILGFARTLYEYQEFTSSALTETTGSSRTTRRWCGVNRSAAW